MDWKRQACSSPCYLASEQRARQRRHCLNWKNPHKAFIDSLVDFHKGPGWHQMRLRWSSDEQERWPFVPLKSNSGCAVKGQMEGKKVLEHRELFCIAPSQDHQIKRDQSPCFFALEIRLLTSSVLLLCHINKGTWLDEFGKVWQKIIRVLVICN